MSFWKGQKQGLDYYIGVRKEDARGDLSGTVMLNIAGGTYAVFETPPASHTDFVNMIHRTWDYIVGEWLPENGYVRTGGFELESYVEESRTFSETIYIPIKKNEEKGMKKLEVNFLGTTDTTGYLFSMAKCLSAVLRCSAYKDYADDIVASSGFAFRMWVAPDLCPSAMSTWDFTKQKEWVENGGLTCEYVERLWNEDTVEEVRRLTAIQQIRNSIDNGMAAVAWDVSGCEWGIVNGYDDETQILHILKIDGNEENIHYDQLGKLEIPILSVLTVVGKTDKTTEQIVADTKKLAVSHLRGEEWCENAKGLGAYDALIDIASNKLTKDMAWQLEYYLGTYAALKWYAWLFFLKYAERECAEIYESVYKAWQAAFDVACKSDVTSDAVKCEIVELLGAAKKAEEKFVAIVTE